MENSPPPPTKSPPEYVLALPVFDFPPLSIPPADRTRMDLGSTPYNVFFGKFVLRALFADYFEEANRFSTRVMLRRSDGGDDDDGFDFTAAVKGPLDRNPDEEILGNAQFRLARVYEDIQVCNDIYFLVPERTCLLKSRTYFPQLGFGATCFLPILSNSGFLEDSAVVGFRCDHYSDSSNLSVGATLDPRLGGYPSTAWLVSRFGRLTAGVQYEPKFGSQGGSPFENLANWSGAISYGSGPGGPLAPSLSFGLELANNSRFILSFYRHIVLQKRLKKPRDTSSGISCTWMKSYIDFGFELQTRVDDGKLSNKIQDSIFQAVASWQLNENILVKGKIGSVSSSIALAIKSWLKPPLTFSVSAIKNRINGETSFGFGIQIDEIRRPSYERKFPNIIL